MSLNVVSDVGATLDKAKLKYISTKKDKYKNEFVYYAIKNKDFDDIINDVGEDMKCPWFKGKGGHVLKVKSKYLTEEQKINGEAVIILEQYEYEDMKGYYVNKIEFK